MPAVEGNEWPMLEAQINQAPVEEVFAYMQKPKDRLVKGREKFIGEQMFTGTP